MATGVTKLRPKSPEGASRAALVAALKELKTARGSVNRQRDAMERLRARQIEAETAIPAAEKAVKKAQAAYVEAVAEAAASGSPEPASGVARRWRVSRSRQTKFTR
jgi:TPP-dependent pyruvate/acetoin dehydrogenase alpha subunit